MLLHSLYGSRKVMVQFWDKLLANKKRSFARLALVVCSSIANDWLLEVF